MLRPIDVASLATLAGVDEELAFLTITSFHAVSYIDGNGNIIWYHSSFRDYILMKYRSCILPTCVRIIHRCWDVLSHEPSLRNSLIDWPVVPWEIDESTATQALVDEIVELHCAWRYMNLFRAYTDHSDAVENRNDSILGQGDSEDV